MCLKSPEPDNKTQDPFDVLEDFRKRVAMYEKKYIPLEQIEELVFAPCLLYTALHSSLPQEDILSALPSERQI